MLYVIIILADLVPELFFGVIGFLFLAAAGSGFGWFIWWFFIKEAPGTWSLQGWLRERSESQKIGRHDGARR